MKTLGIVIGAVFVGAVGMEIIRRTYPKALKKAYAKTRGIAAEAKEAFGKGYQAATGPKKTAKATA
jgi:DNA primase